MQTSLLRLLAYWLSFLFYFSAYAVQDYDAVIVDQWLKIGGYANAHSSAALDINSTSKGILIPRMTEVQRDAIGSPQTHLLIVNTTTGELNIYDGADWVGIGGGSITVTANRAVVSDGSGALIASDITDAEIEALDDITGNIQDLLDAKLTTPTFTDNRLIRANGTASIESTGITITDLDEITGAAIDAGDNIISNLTDAEIAVGAGIQRDKSAAGTASHVVINDGGGDFSSEAQLAISRGGTGQASANAALNALLPTQTGNSGEFLTTDGTTASWAASSGSGLPSGSIVHFAGSSAPTGYLLAYGQAVSRATYAALFTAISTTYGSGDGSTTFNLPDCRGRVIAGDDDMGGSSANRLTNQSGGLNGDTLGATGGAETHTLTAAEMPVHEHSQRAGNNSNHVQPGVAGAFSGRDFYGLAGDQTSKALVNTYSAGSGNTHNNVQPTIIFNCIIKE
jgi:microcystin-dependent protein